MLDGTTTATFGILVQWDKRGLYGGGGGGGGGGVIVGGLR
jgi:hypothetical protein